MTAKSEEFIIKYVDELKTQFESGHASKSVRAYKHRKKKAIKD